MYEIKLYVSGEHPRAKKAIKDLEEFLEANFKDQYLFTVINLMEDPEAADVDNIFVTPTAVRVSPHPVKKIIGDFSNEADVRSGLGLTVD